MVVEPEFVSGVLEVPQQPGKDVNAVLDGVGLNEAVVAYAHRERTTRVLVAHAVSVSWDRWPRGQGLQLRGVCSAPLA